MQGLDLKESHIFSRVRMRLGMLIAEAKYRYAACCGQAAGLPQMWYSSVRHWMPGMMGAAAVLCVAATGLRRCICMLLVHAHAADYVLTGACHVLLPCSLHHAQWTCTHAHQPAITPCRISSVYCHACILWLLCERIQTHPIPHRVHDTSTILPFPVTSCCDIEY